MTLGHMMYPAVWSFVGDYRYGWSEQQIGFSLGVFGLGGAFVMAFVLPRVIPKLGEWRTAAIGLTFTVLAAFGYAAAWKGWMIYAVIVASVPGGARRSAARKPCRRQGAALRARRIAGAMTSLFSITAIVTPLIYTQIFA